MLQQQETASGQKYLSLWQRVTLITAMLISGGSVVSLAPSQAVYAHNHSSHMRSTYHQREKQKERNTQKKTIQLLIVCKAGHGGKGGYATKRSNGAYGGAGGNCVINVPITVSLKIPHGPRDTNAYHEKRYSHAKNAHNDTSKVREIR